jgi:hypothetical protein
MVKAIIGSAITGDGIAAALFGAGTGDADTHNMDAIEAQHVCDLIGSIGPALGYDAKQAFRRTVWAVEQDTGMPESDAVKFAVQAINTYCPEHRGDITTG